MPLSAQRLGAAMVAAAGIDPSVNPAGVAAMNALAQAIVAEFVANAVVTTSIAVGALASGVLSGGASAPVTGNTTGTIA